MTKQDLGCIKMACSEPWEHEDLYSKGANGLKELNLKRRVKEYL